MREFDYLAILFTQRIRGKEMAQDVTEAPVRLMKPDTYPSADEFGELNFELFWHETTINPPLNIAQQRQLPLEFPTRHLVQHLEAARDLCDRRPMRRCKR